MIFCLVIVGFINLVSCFYEGMGFFYLSGVWVFLCQSWREYEKGQLFVVFNRKFVLVIGFNKSVK